MKIRSTLALLAIALFVLAALLGTPLRAEPAARPNILFFITDDESWRERSVYGWSEIPTPAFDRVAREGVLFNHAYASAPSCAPSRASVITGRNFWELEEGGLIQAWVPRKFAVLGELLRESGYQTAVTGKGWGPGIYPPTGWSEMEMIGETVQTVKDPERQKSISSIDYAATFARWMQKRDSSKPFFFWAGVTEPHAPYAGDNHRKLIERYGVPLEKTKVPGFLPDTPVTRRERANFAYEVLHADAHLGRMLEALQQAGELENTLVIVSSDNGTLIPARGKATLYDWGVHVPLAIMWPGKIKAGRKVDDFVTFPDLGVTMLDAAGAKIPGSMSGRSFFDSILLSEASGRIDASRDVVITGLEWHGEFAPVSRAGRMIRDHRYEYVVHFGKPPFIELDPKLELPDGEYDKTVMRAKLEALLSKHPGHPRVSPFIETLAQEAPREALYDLQEDPWERHNLINDPAHADIVRRLKTRLQAYQVQTGDPRVTGKMDVFERTLDFIQQRKKEGYKPWNELSPALQKSVLETAQ